MTEPADVIVVGAGIMGVSTAYHCTTAIAARARDLGVVIEQGREVRGFIRQGDRVTGVITDAGSVDVHGRAVTMDASALDLARFSRGEAQSVAS